MKIPRLNLWRYQKSLSDTQKIKRTISHNRPYTQKANKQAAEKEQKMLVYLEKQKQLDLEFQEKLNNALIDMQAQDITFNMLWLYGIKIKKEKVIEILKARKAK